MQNCVTLSVVEAELVAAVDCAQVMLFTMHVLESMGLKVYKPMLLEMDSKGAIDMASNFSVSGCTRHMDVSSHFLREMKEAGIIYPVGINDEANCADLFTKNLGGEPFNRHSSVFVAENISELTIPHQRQIPKRKMNNNEKNKVSSDEESDDEPPPSVRRVRDMGKIGTFALEIDPCGAPSAPAKWYTMQAQKERVKAHHKRKLCHMATRLIYANENNNKTKWEKMEEERKAHEEIIRAIYADTSDEDDDEKDEEAEEEEEVEEDEVIEYKLIRQVYPGDGVSEKVKKIWCPVGDTVPYHSLCHYCVPYNEEQRKALDEHVLALIKSLRVTDPVQKARIKQLNAESKKYFEEMDKRELAKTKAQDDTDFEEAKPKAKKQKALTTPQQGRVLGSYEMDV